MDGPHCAMWMQMNFSWVGLGWVGLVWVGLIYRKVETGRVEHNQGQGRIHVLGTWGARPMLNLKILHEFHLIRIILVRFV